MVRYLLTPERLTKAATRRHRLDGLGPFLEYARRAAETAAFVAVNNDMHNRYALDGALYHRLRDPRVSSAITQGCIRQGAAAAKNIYDPERAPAITKPILSLNNQKWKLNPVGDAYIARANLGTREHPRVITIPVAKNIGDIISEHRRGELSIGRTHFSMTYSKEAPPPVQVVRRDNPNIAELTTNIDYVGGEPQPMMAVDMNAYGCMAGDDGMMAKFDLSGRVDDVIRAKTENTYGDQYRKKTNIWRYERRKKRRVSNGNADRKRRERIVRLGGERKIRKDGRDIHRLKKEMKGDLRVLTNELRRAVRGVGEAERKAIKQEFAARRKTTKAEYKVMIAKTRTMKKRRERALNHTHRADCFVAQIIRGSDPTNQHS